MFHCRIILIALFTLSFAIVAYGETYIRVNQIGYRPDEPKRAVVMSKKDLSNKEWQVVNQMGKSVLKGNIDESVGAWLNNLNHHVIYFTELNEEGTYHLIVDKVKSPAIHIGNDVYNEVFSALLDFYKYQHCGHERIMFDKPCHTLDATFIYGGDLAGESIDAEDGWHDAGDYVKFTITTAHTVYLLMLTQQLFHFKGEIKEKIISEALIGLRWLEKMNYGVNQLLTQVSDLRDHDVGWRLPEDDSLTKNRPAFYGPSLTMFSSISAAYAISSQVYSSLNDTLNAEKYFNLALSTYPHNSSDVIPATSSGPDSMYFDDTDWDNLALASVELNRLRKADNLQENAINNLAGKQTFWLSWGDVGALARLRADFEIPENREQLIVLFDYFNNIALHNPFGYPLEEFPWGSSSVQSGIGALALLHQLNTGQDRYMELALWQRDFILGLNPYGVCFVTGFGELSPKYPHHQIAKLMKIELPGALMEGLIDPKLMEQMGIEPPKADPFARFQSEFAVYFDDEVNYLTNEPTIVANAQLILLLAWFVSNK